MQSNFGSGFDHPRLSRRRAIECGAIGLLGLGTNHLAALRAEAASTTGIEPSPRAKSCIYIFLSGGLAQHESFDPKPDAPEKIRGEFRPIATDTPGYFICEYLPLLAKRSRLWSVCRSLTHPSNDHSAGHHIMLTGRSDLPRGFDATRPTSNDWPSIASVVGAMQGARNNLPPAVVLPEKLIHFSGRVIPGQFAGQMGSNRDPWFIEASPYHATSYGAYPQYQFDHQERGHKDERVFQAPSLSLPEELLGDRLRGRLGLLEMVESQARQLDQFAVAESFDGYRQGVISMLTDARVRHAFDVTRADDQTQDRYGRNCFGWSLLMARRLVEAGVRLVQVNLGNDETWDTHGDAFPHLKDKLLPPTDKALSALLDDFHESGMLDSTLIVMAGEFGRTPKISHLSQFYQLPGRDHWGAVQSVFFAGGGIQGGRVVGASDKYGAYPAECPQTPENMGATIYSLLGIPSESHWHDAAGRPNQVYRGIPIAELL